MSGSWQGLLSTDRRGQRVRALPDDAGGGEQGHTSHSCGAACAALPQGIADPPAVV